MEVVTWYYHDVNIIKIIPLYWLEPPPVLVGGWHHLNWMYRWHLCWLAWVRMAWWRLGVCRCEVDSNQVVRVEGDTYVVLGHLFLYCATEWRDGRWTRVITCIWLLMWWDVRVSMMSARLGAKSCLQPVREGNVEWCVRFIWEKSDSGKRTRRWEWILSM